MYTASAVPRNNLCLEYYVLVFLVFLFFFYYRDAFQGGFLRTRGQVS